MSKRKVIENDDQYEKAQKAVIEMAKEMLDPSLTKEEFDKMDKIYDRTVALMQYYSRGRIVQESPNMAAHYDNLGWSYQTFD